MHKMTAVIMTDCFWFPLIAYASEVDRGPRTLGGTANIFAREIQNTAGL